MKGGARARRTAGSTSATTAGASYAIRASDGGRRSGASSTQRPPLRLRLAATSTRRPRSPTGASTSATPTAACTRSPPPAASSPGAAAPAATSTPRPPSRRCPGYAPTVYVGSYSGRFYALDARSGAVRWSRGGNGRISGGATVIGDIVYFADLGTEEHVRARRPHGPQGVRARARLLQPGRLRRRDDLPGRLPRAVRAAAALGRRQGRARKVARKVRRRGPTARPAVPRARSAHGGDRAAQRRSTSAATSAPRAPARSAAGASACTAPRRTTASRPRCSAPTAPASSGAASGAH